MARNKRSLLAGATHEMGRVRWMISSPLSCINLTRTNVCDSLPKQMAMELAQFLLDPTTPEMKMKTKRRMLASQIQMKMMAG